MRRSEIGPPLQTDPTYRPKLRHAQPARYLVPRKPRDQDESDLPVVLAAARAAGLAGAGYTRLEQLTQVTASDLLKLHGMGPNAIEQLRRALAERQLSLAREARIDLRCQT